MTSKTMKKLKMVTLFSINFLIIFSLSLQGSTITEQNGNKKPLAIINEEIITLEYFEKIWNSIPDNYKFQISKEDILEQVITQTLLIQKADELSLREDPEIAFQIKNTVDHILIQFLLEREIVDKTTLSHEDIKNFYEENKENYWHEEEVHALNILVETEAEAKEIIKKLEEGEEFSDLAKEKSIASTAPAGGDIGFIRKGTLMTEIEEQLFALDIGDFSDIIQTERGFHIFKVVEKNPSGYLELDEVKEKIENQLLPLKQQEAFDQYLRDIENIAVIEKNIELLEDIEE